MKIGHPTVARTNAAAAQALGAKLITPEQYQKMTDGTVSFTDRSVAKAAWAKTSVQETPATRNETQIAHALFEAINEQAIAQGTLTTHLETWKAAPTKPEFWDGLAFAFDPLERR